MDSPSLKDEAAKLNEAHEVLQAAIELLLLPPREKHEIESVRLSIRTCVATIQHRLECVLDAIGYSVAEELDGSAPEDC